MKRILLLLCMAVLIYLFVLLIQKKQTVVHLTCSNTYTIIARYHTPDTKGVMSKLTITVSKNGTSNTYDMIPAISGSGSRYETEDQQYSFWEHQGTFTLAKNDTPVTVCTDSK